MERLRQMLSTISAQMSVLTVSQRIAIGLCAALVAGSLLWLMQWSTTPNMVPLVDRQFSFDALSSAEDALEANHIDYQTRGTRVYVRAQDQHNALRVLHSVDALPDGSLFDMVAAVTEQSPFQSPEARQYAQNVALGNELAKIISTTPFVQQASVIINPVSKRRLGGRSEVPTASADVALAPGKEITPEMVDGFARLIAGAVAGLKPFNVTVRDSRTGHSYNVPRPGDAASFDHLGIVKRHENHIRAKIIDKLADIPGLRATVTVELDTSRRTIQKNTHDAPQPKIEKSQSTETNSMSQPTEPGVQPNLGTAVTATGGGQSSTMDEMTENFEPKLTEVETIERMPFTVKRVTAAVGIPRSFIVGVFKAQNPDAPEPNDDDAKFQAIRDDQIERVRASVENIVMAKSERDVQVDVYPDMEWSTGGGTWRSAPSGLASTMTGNDDLDPITLARTYGPAAGLASLALISLLMMTRIVRKSSAMVDSGRASVRHEQATGDDERILSVGPQTVGHAAASESFLTAREVDDDTLRYKELAEEVSKMVEDDPTAAANLIRRWIDGDE